MEPAYCKHCDRWKPLTEDFWHRNKRLPSGFATDKCKECRRTYTADMAHRYRREQKLRKLEKEHLQPDYFGEFEKAALEDQIKRMKQSTCSTDMEILG